MTGFDTSTGGLQTDPNWDWRTDAEETPEQLLANWLNAVARSRSRVSEALADGGLDQPDQSLPFGRTVLDPACDGSSAT
jgi:hypothetical protein